MIWSKKCCVDCITIRKTFCVFRKRGLIEQQMMGHCPCFGMRKAKKLKRIENNRNCYNNYDDDDLDLNLKPELSSPDVNVVRPKTNTEQRLESLARRGGADDRHHTARTFTYEQLVTATSNFREEYLIGRGGFGAVYKGKLEEVVAVKQLDQGGLQGEKEFLVEVLMLSLMHHPNLVNLIGYCAEDDQRLLVYEYMPLGCLEDHLFDLADDTEPLEWNTRMMIAAGAAKGLEFLHSAEPPVIYRDVKSANILLGEGFHPKLSDFGLAKFGPTGDKSHVSTRVMGTHGYCAPEYAKTGQLTTKSDIFSFGVVLLELITGRPARNETHGRERLLVDWVSVRFKDSKNVSPLADPQLRGRFSEPILRKALELAILCIHDDPDSRPPMSHVVNALDDLVSQPYDPNEAKRTPCESEANGILGEDSDRERAVAEAKKWGETLREKKTSKHSNF